MLILCKQKHMFDIQKKRKVRVWVFSNMREYRLSLLSTL